MIRSILTLLEDQFEWETLNTPKVQIESVDELTAEYIEVNSSDVFPREEYEDGVGDWVDILDVD
jgi:hypothetical protein